MTKTLLGSAKVYLIFFCQNFWTLDAPAHCVIGSAITPRGKSPPSARISGSADEPVSQLCGKDPDINREPPILRWTVGGSLCGAGDSESYRCTFTCPKHWNMRDGCELHCSWLSTEEQLLRERIRHWGWMVSLCSTAKRLSLF